MSQLIGFISGIALTAGAIYYFTPDQGKDILDTLSQKTAASASALYAQLPATGLETVLTPQATASNPLPPAATAQSQPLVSGPPSPPQVSAKVTETLIRATENAEPEADDSDDSTPIDDATPITDAPANTQLFWTPFENRQQAQGFIDYLAQKTGFAYELLTEQDGAQTHYRAALSYQSDAELAAMMATIEQITGPWTR